MPKKRSCSSCRKKKKRRPKKKIRKTRKRKKKVDGRVVVGTENQKPVCKRVCKFERAPKGFKKKKPPSRIRQIQGRARYARLVERGQVAPFQYRVGARIIRKGQLLPPDLAFSWQGLTEGSSTGRRSLEEILVEEDIPISIEEGGVKRPLSERLTRFEKGKRRR